MEPFKNRINSDVTAQIAEAILRNYPDFDRWAFLKNIQRELASLELKARVHFVAEKLNQFLPKEMEKTIPFLVGAIKQNDADKIGLSGFALWPLTHYISLYGLGHFELSLNALKEMTKHFTSEFAVRPFIIKDQKGVLKYFKIWVNDENEHVRRWISEGPRPLLPWAIKLNDFVESPEITWRLLEKLKNDPSAYVRKSVANHINDHSKNHPEFVIEKLSEWKNSKKITKETDWIIKHATRTLIKKGHKKAFKLHGIFDTKIKVINQKILTPKLKLGGSLVVFVEIKNETNKSANLILDHEIHFLKANGRHTIKIFKGKKIILAPKEKKGLEFSIPLKLVTTRVYYPGKHFWNIKINGESFPPKSFLLTLV